MNKLFEKSFYNIRIEISIQMLHLKMDFVKLVFEGKKKVFKLLFFLNFEINLKQILKILSLD